MAEYTKSEELEELGNKVIAENNEFAHLRDGVCRIAYQYCDTAKKSNGKVVYADTMKVSEKMKQFAAYDFVITFYAGNTNLLDDETMEHLMFHELLHVGYDPDNVTFSIVPHDLEDFKEVIERWGVSWINEGV